MPDPESPDEATAVQDPGLVRAGAAAAARRRELDISQRRLAAEGIINAGALIAFEKGRSWPRERTRAKLEQVLQWPPGTIARLRRGEPAAAENRTEPPSAQEMPLVAQAVVSAADTLASSIETLPPVDDPAFTALASTILAGLRQFEEVATQAVLIGKVTPALIKALSTLRRSYDELMLRAARSPRATLGQRLYAARRSASLTVLETAQAAGVSEVDVVAAEAEEPVSEAAVKEIEALIGQLDWR